MTSDEFVPVDFDPPTSLVTDQFRLEPLGPQHNRSDHAAWMSSIEHIRSTPGYPDGRWPPHDGMTLEENLNDLRRHADDFARRAGFTFTVLDPSDDDVIGCVYLYPPASEDWDVTVQSWVRADRADLDGPLAETVARWRSPPTGPGSVWTAAVADSCSARDALEVLFFRRVQDAWIADVRVVGDVPGRPATGGCGRGP